MDWCGYILNIWAIPIYLQGWALRLSYECFSQVNVMYFMYLPLQLSDKLCVWSIAKIFLSWHKYPDYTKKLQKWRIWGDKWQHIFITTGSKVNFILYSIIYEAGSVFKLRRGLKLLHWLFNGNIRAIFLTLKLEIVVFVHFYIIKLAFDLKTLKPFLLL